eukprot:scaffold273721_cov36-Tisochrysis_lutea.AAC.2
MRWSSVRTSSSPTRANVCRRAVVRCGVLPGIGRPVVVVLDVGVLPTLLGRIADAASTSHASADDPSAQDL